METTVSTKGQVVLPQKARQQLALRPGAKLSCRVARGSIVLTPKSRFAGRPKLVRDVQTGLMITRTPAETPAITSKQVRAALAEFP